MLELGITFGYGQLVMDNEIAQMIKRVVRGVAIDDENLAVDVIKKVGAGGHFLGEEHTIKYMKTLQSQPKLIDRRRREFWQSDGGTSLAERAAEEARNILLNHKPDPLPEGVPEKLRSIVEEAEEEFQVKK